MNGGLINKDQGSGVIERAIYSAILFVALKYGSYLGLSGDDAAWIAAGGMLLTSGAWAWWHNRPAAVLKRGADALPNNTKLVLATLPHATDAEKAKVFALGEAAGPKVVARTSL